MPWEAWAIILFSIFGVVSCAFYVGRGKPITFTGSTLISSIIMNSFLVFCAVRLATCSG